MSIPFKNLTTFMSLKKKNQKHQKHFESGSWARVVASCIISMDYVHVGLLGMVLNVVIT